MKGTAGEESAPTSTAVLTVPNVISLGRILSIPVFWWLIVHERTTAAGLILFVAVAATDWVDGYVARRTGQVSELGKVLDPVADRLAITSGLLALVMRDAFPLWAALLVLIRDALVLVVGAALLAGRRVSLDVRTVGKVATFTLMAAIPAIAWGNLGLPLGEVTLPAGWVAFAVGIVEYFAAAILYTIDLRRVLSSG
jgi:cardiolipin synthase (CMP-forming)